MSDKKVSQATTLVKYVRDGDEYALGITESGEPYGTKFDAPHIALMLRGGKSGLRAELAQRFFDDYEIAPSQQALADAGQVLEGYARRATPKRADLRVSERSAVIYIDMGDDAATVIRIEDGGWRLDRAAPVLFRRTKLTGQLAMPNRRGDLSKLWDFVLVDDDDKALILAWLVATIVLTDVPHPILALLTEHGSAKSSVTRCLVDLVDPSAVPLRQPPRDIEGWSTAAAASWVVAIDNLAGALPDWLSDCLCRASTGDGYVKRQLYSDNDVAVAAYRRCCIINGVDLTIDRGDLADRLLPADLKRPDKRLTERNLTKNWDGARAEILGGLLNLAATVAAKLPEFSIDDLRMADFAAVLAAVDAECGSNGMARYRERVERATVDTLDGSFIGALIDKPLDCSDTPSKEILTILTPTDKDWRKPRDWPANARAATAQLTRHAPALRLEGWEIDNDRGGNKQNRLHWTIRPPSRPEKAGREHSPDSPYSPSGESRTCEGELASQASQEYSPSLDGGPASDATLQFHPPLWETRRECACGNELTAPEAKRSGKCKPCRDDEAMAGYDQ